uniref:RING1 and YY1 binding protein n=1 Tax=Coturnix japonica TaxID=93934 RepID=A0A8C2YFV8_COTJA
MVMGDKKSPTRPKRQAKPAADEGFWDCSVCTFRNSAEAFKCSICDVRKGTSTRYVVFLCTSGSCLFSRKPRINSQLVAQQVAQQYATPPPPKKEKKEKVEKQDKEKPDKEKEISPSVTKKNTNKKTKPKSDIVKDPPSEANSIQSGNTTTKTSDSNHTSRPRLKNVDRSTAQQLAVTVGNVTVRSVPGGSNLDRTHFLELFLPHFLPKQWLKCTERRLDFYTLGCEIRGSLQGSSCLYWGNSARYVAGLCPAGVVGAQSQAGVSTPHPHASVTQASLCHAWPIPQKFGILRCN